MKRALALALALSAGCAGPEVAFDRRYDFSQVRRVGVLAFGGAGGGAAADIVAHELLAAGASVAERGRMESVLDEHRLRKGGALTGAEIRLVGRALGVDAIVLGTVTQFSQPQSYLVLNSSGSVYGSAVSPIGGGRVSQAPALGLPGASVLTSAARVGLTARLIDVKTGAVVWSAHQSYEGFDVDSAFAAVARSFARSLAALWAPR